LWPGGGSFSFPVTAPHTIWEKVSIPRAAKDLLNTRLHGEVLGLVTSPPDYTASKAAMQPVLDRLAVDGWVITPAWDGAAKVWLRRSVVISVSRTPKHQAFVKSLPIEHGGVPADDPGTYERVYTTQIIHELNGPMILADGTKIPLDEQPAIVAVIALNAKARGPRPSNWLRDL